MGNLLVPLKKFLGNKNTITILAVLIGIVVLYFGYTWRVNQSISPTQVPYATQIIPAGEVITDDMIGYTDVPKDMLKEMKNIVTNPKSIIDKLVKLIPPIIIPTKGIIISLTKDVTIELKAPPITTPTAKSSTFPLEINSLNSFNNCFIFYTPSTLTK